MNWLRNVIVGAIVATSLLFVTPSTTDAQQVVVRSGRGWGGYATPYYRRYAARPSYRPYRAWGSAYYGPSYRGRVYLGTPRVRVIY